MKNIPAITLFVALFMQATGLAAQDNEGIRFRDDFFEELLTQARTEKKMVFIDCYTTWCGPCKRMDQEVFPLKTVGDFFNEKFVSAKVDMERGEGISLRKQFDVSNFPTYLFFNADGELLFRLAGARPAESFIEEVEKGLVNQRFSKLTRRYNQGERTPKFIQEYLAMLAQDGMYETCEKVTRDYLGDGSGMLADSVGFHAFCHYITSPEDPAFLYVYSHRIAFAERYGATWVDEKLWEVWREHPASFARFDGKRMLSYSQDKLNAYGKYMKKHKVKHYQTILQEYAIFNAFYRNDWPATLKACKQYASMPHISDRKLLEYLETAKAEVTAPADRQLLAGIARQRLTALEKQPAPTEQTNLYYQHKGKRVSRHEQTLLRYRELTD